MTGLIVLVTGGREYRDREHVWSVLSRIHEATPIEVLAHGGATGADEWGKKWGLRYGVQPVEYPACWTAYGRPAGPKRNGVMFEHARADIVVAFPGNSGTAGMVEIARNAIKTHGVLCELRACCREHPLP